MARLDPRLAARSRATIDTLRAMDHTIVHGNTDLIVALVRHIIAVYVCLNILRVRAGGSLRRCSFFLLIRCLSFFLLMPVLAVLRRRSSRS